MSDSPTANREISAGLFLLSLATLMQEVLLTRIFSVTLWYHLAFVAISIAVFGLTVGAIAVYLLPEFFAPQRARAQMAAGALGFAITLLGSLLANLYLIRDANWIGVTYVLSAVPFVFSGIAITIALTRFPARVGKLYAADLAGGAVGCFLTVQLLAVIDAPSAVIAVAAAGATAAFLFSSGSSIARPALIFASAFACFAAGHAYLASRQAPILGVRWVKGMPEARPIYQEWNSFSRIAVFGSPDVPKAPFGWGISSRYPRDRKVRELFLNIDAAAMTVMTRFDGNRDALQHLKYDVTNIAHWLRPDGSVLVIGAGGGRDVLSALAFGEKNVVAVEMNESILRLLHDRFAAFTGHLYRFPGVRLVNDEARSYTARTADQFDLIQISLIDTWAATAAGGFVLSENSLYTLEAWRLFLERLTPEGVLSVSRYYTLPAPAEAYRMTVLARRALAGSVATGHEKHVLLVTQMPPGGSDGLVTLLMSRSEFSPQALDTIYSVAADMQFQVVAGPRGFADPTFAAILSQPGMDQFEATFPLDISAPTDDRPFFFHMRRFKDLVAGWSSGTLRNEPASLVAVLLAVVTGLTALCIMLPLFLTRRRVPLAGSAPFLVFFAAIGFGFMLIEMSQMQRLILFLGHPTYSLSVVLASLLLAGGAGSYSTQSIGESEMRGAGTLRLALLLAALAAAGWLTPRLTATFQSSSQPVRIAIAVALLSVPGIFMGTAFPLGMRLAATRLPHVGPWLWGINGATSVCASVLAVVIALTWGVSASFWTGVAWYAVAMMAWVWAVASSGLPHSALPGVKSMRTSLLE